MEERRAFWKWHGRTADTLQIGSAIPWSSLWRLVMAGLPSIAFAILGRLKALWWPETFAVSVISYAAVVFLWDRFDHRRRAPGMGRGWRPSHQLFDRNQLLLDLKNEGPEREAQIIRCIVQDPSGNQAVAENPRVTIRAGSSAWFNYPKVFTGPSSLMDGAYRVVWESQADLFAPRVRLSDETLDVIVPVAAVEPSVPETLVGSKDWQELAQKFGQVPPHVRADWCISDTSVKEPVQWQSLTGGPYAKECAALCRIAGKMILRSPKVAASLTDAMRSRHEPLDRWLDFLKARYRGPENTLHGESQRDDGTKIFSLLGQLEHVGQESLTACLNCAADEI